MRYLSPAEARLNLGLQVLLAVALVYCVAQHVVLADTPEVLAGAADVGDLLFNLAAAYVVTYGFYVLVVRVPLVRDRRNVYRHLGPLIRQVVDMANMVIVALNQAAGFDESRENTLLHIEEVCRTISPDDKTMVSYSFDATGGSVRYFGDVVGALEYHKKCTHQLCEELLTFATYLPSEIISLIGLIENDTHFPYISQCRPIEMGGETLYAKDLSVLSFGLFDYLVFADRLDKDHGKYLPAAQGRPAYLKAAYEQRDSFVPLKRFLVSASA